MSYPVRIKPETSGYSDELSNCYPWWINFIETEISPLFDLFGGNKQFEAERDKVYRKYHFRQPELCSKDDDFIYFDNEEFCTMFLLRWS